MRNILLSTAVYSAETENGSAPRILPDVSADKPETAMQAAIRTDGEKRKAAKADSGKRKLSTKSKSGNAKAKPDADKPESKPVETHGMRGSYRGASPTFRQHGRKLSPIVLDRVPGSFTERDAAFLRDLHSKHGTKPFKRFDADAGNVSRAIGHGYLRHASGNLDSRDATFAVTERYVRERTGTVRAPKA